MPSGLAPLGPPPQQVQQAFYDANSLVLETPQQVVQVTLGEAKVIVSQVEIRADYLHLGGEKPTTPVTQISGFKPSSQQPSQVQGSSVRIDNLLTSQGIVSAFDIRGLASSLSASGR